RFYSNFTGEPTDAKAVLRQGKRRVLRELFASEVGRLTEILVKIAGRHSRWIRLGRDSLLAALTELIACFPVYRSYVQPGRGVIAEADFVNIREAVSSASVSRPELAESFDFLNELLLSQLDGPLENDFVSRFQQFTGAVMAKGVEDTAFYCFNRLAALNEVGGDPGRFGVQPEVFHERCFFRQARQPGAMLSSTTHDTKRSEDVRARLCLISEIPALWQRAVTRWAAMNEQFRQHEWLDRNAEYLFYQILFGAWPISVERALAYMEKAAREAKQHTTWADKNPDYETALRHFVSGALANAEFARDLDDFVASLMDAGWINSLAGALLKLTAPGVPDIYQGTELWDLSLVDPDNRRPVDFNLRRRLLSELDSHTADEIWSSRGEGLPKLWLIRQTLKFRSARPELSSGSGDYEPLRAKGANAAHVLAFIRSGASATIVPRLVLGVAGDWGDTSIEIPPGNWRNVFTSEEFTGGCLRLDELFRRFPVALLTR
ncbi:MAG TPA: malto-oligosyltrehalose synthase, partial [Verrucomicrobiae bacterium]|nr:malto-oligosyltrehalose synthase [Verrucomicrobiae bacterium]